MISRLAAGLTRHPAMAGAVLSLLSLPIHLVLPEAVSIPFAAVILGLVAGSTPVSRSRTAGRTSWR